ncbi:hypothetical protein LCM02_12900 [Lutimonas saemankumensis]|uniref:hypothetical protein n=1 Tax=Lutimonas saemankumensis TaxID=483016 RepID=UPI001CD4F237|nr:hypothetical protein [Lutimonas saemankumensis]MCA0933354.1 hypothetical protein [Lutimonas saemankumensis]
MIPVIRYVLGSCFILGVTSLMNYDLAYLTSVLSLGYLAPGAKPLSFKQGGGFLLILTLITGTAVIFSELFLEYAMVFMPLLLLSLLWLYYTDKIPMMVKLFSLISMVIIPFVSIDTAAIGSYVASRLVFNAFMAVLLSQIIFMVFPLCEADIPFEKKKEEARKKTDRERYNYAISIIVILLPVLLLFYMFKLSSSVLILTFIAILSISPALANPKVGLVMIVANILGGLFGILGYKLLVIVPNFTFMILLVFVIGMFFGSRLFSDSKYAAIFGSGFSTFLLILGSVTSSDAEAGSKVWSRVIQISIAVIYVVIAFNILNRILESKKKETA